MLSRNWLHIWIPHTILGGWVNFHGMGPHRGGERGSSQKKERMHPFLQTSYPTPSAQDSILTPHQKKKKTKTKNKMRGGRVVRVIEPLECLELVVTVVFFHTAYVNHFRV